MTWRLGNGKVAKLRASVANRSRVGLAEVPHVRLACQSEKSEQTRACSGGNVAGSNVIERMSEVLFPANGDLPSAAARLFDADAGRL